MTEQTELLWLSCPVQCILLGKPNLYPERFYCNSVKSQRLKPINNIEAGYFTTLTDSKMWGIVRNATTVFQLGISIGTDTRDQR